MESDSFALENADRDQSPERRLKLLTQMGIACLRRLDGWEKDVLPDGGGSGWKMSIVTGGLTNKLFRCTRIDSNESALVRVYGEATGAFFQRKREEAIFEELSRKGFGPKLLGKFPGGRIEEWINGCPISDAEMKCPASSAEIARILADLHSIDMRTLANGKNGECEPVIFSRLLSWSAAAANAITHLERSRGSQCPILARIKASGFIAKSASSDDLPSELMWLHSVLEKVAGPVVFCHHDVIAGNILRDTIAKKLRLIDYEYGDFDFRAMDLANHFNEWAICYGIKSPPYFRVSPRKAYPSREKRVAFLTAYAERFLDQQRSDNKNNNRTAPVDDLVDDLEREVAAFAMASDALWSLWALIQAESSSIEEFDYAEYAVARLGGYEARKAEWMHTYATS